MPRRTDADPICSCIVVDFQLSSSRFQEEKKIRFQEKKVGCYYATLRRRSYLYTGYVEKEIKKKERVYDLTCRISPWLKASPISLQGNSESSLGS